MRATELPANVEQELGQAIDDLKEALARASEATAAIRALVPRLAAAGSVLDEIEALVRSGREQIHGTLPPAVAPAADLRPLLSALGSAPAKTTASASRLAAEPAPASDPVASLEQNAGASAICFRLEFESSSGPLDLRTIDDAIGAHPAVQDVALLDYDGHRAALKVWITDDATPAEVQAELKQRLPELFADNNDGVTVTALEDVA